MGSRIVAALVVVAGGAALLWVALGGNAVDTAAELAAVQAAPTTESSTAPADDTSDASDSDDSKSNASDGESEAVANNPETPAPPALPEGLENQGPRMDLVDIDGWLQTDATSIDDFDGQVLLVEMWTFGCHNCKARIPFNQSYYEEFGDENFEILGVHAPEFAYEGELENIENALVNLGVTWPQALDGEKLNFRAWQPGRRNFWPRTYVIDQNGEIRYDHIGEGRYEELREVIRYLIENPPAPIVS